MISKIKTIIDLLQKNEPATAAEMESFRNTCPVDLPKDYLKFVEYANGTAGSFPNGNHIILWRIERLVERNRAYEVEDYAPGIFVFGSSGGGDAYGFDTRSSMAVIQIPFVGIFHGIPDGSRRSSTKWMVSEHVREALGMMRSFQNRWFMIAHPLDQRLQIRCSGGSVIDASKGSLPERRILRIVAQL